MRDYRDAKAMAQTLRESLNTRSVSLTVSESLELVARLFGLADWNVLAARIRSAERAGSGRSNEESTKTDAADQVRSRAKEIQLPQAVLDRYAGTYQFHSAVFTVTREQDHLSRRLSGQSSAQYYAVGETEFATREIDVELRFTLGPDGMPTAVILRQHGNDHTMPRIDASAAQEPQRAIEVRMSSRSANPGTVAALRRLIESVASGRPNYGEMSADLAEATHKQLPRLQSGLSELGPITSMEFLGVGAQGQDVYSVWHQGGASHWHITLGNDGTIISAFVTPGP
ncbi:glyoxalase superfamily protein [Bradyrhizobium japonicum]|uniref:glyoxalase superfamily protein n=1 Tax=Bradyrhizobium japonicum TaxID=375 RepID=UPI00040EFDCB|nr:glyoxalase superfamily protein [Bradyrhizobium japonicum]WLB90038.1 glyoxalase superfamily protein [Bradyrhizobium japonicum USDA 135]